MIISEMKLNVEAKLSLKVIEGVIMTRNSIGVSINKSILHLDELILQGPPRSYFLEPTKSVLVVSPRNVMWDEEFFREYRLQIVTGSLYLRVFFGIKAEQTRWLEEKIEGWWDLVATLAGVACRHP